MRRIGIFAVSLMLIVTMVGCNGNDTQSTKVTGTTPPTEFQINDILDYTGFLECAKGAFSKIDIEISADSFSFTRDNETSGVRSIYVEAIFDDIPMQFSCFFVDGTWSAVSISNSETKKYYWLDDSVTEYGDVYDWKTGDVISEKSKDFSEVKESFEPIASTKQTITYSDGNSCTMNTTYNEKDMSITGICSFDGDKPESEALYALAFTTYCGQNAVVFANGNLTMLFYSGDEDGFAYYKDGSLTLSDFPDKWADYLPNITETQIEDEVKNIVDNIEKVE